MLRAAACFLILFVMAGTGCAPALGRMVVKTPNHGRDVDSLAEQHFASPAMDDAVIDERFRVATSDPGVSLSVWVIDPSNEVMHDNEQGLWFSIPGKKSRQTHEPVATVLILHGYRHFKNDWAYLMWGRFLAEHDYRAVLVDARGHGASTGQWSTFGPGEARDLIGVVDELDRRGLLVGKLGVFGGSYGGATAIQFAGVEPRVRAVVTVSAFATMRNAVPSFVKGELGWFSGLVGIWGWGRIVMEAGRAGGFDPGDADARKALRQTDAGVMLIHSSNDRHVPVKNAQELMSAGGKTVRFQIMDGPGHFSFGINEAAGVRRVALQWFDDWLK